MNRQTKTLARNLYGTIALPTSKQMIATRLLLTIAVVASYAISCTQASEPNLNDGFRNGATKRELLLDEGLVPDHFCTSRTAFEILMAEGVICNALCHDNLCDGTWLGDADLDGDGAVDVTLPEMWMTCQFDLCGPGLHYQDLFNPATGVRSCNIVGCGATPCSATSPSCQVCEAECEPCYFPTNNAAGCDLDYFNGLLRDFSDELPEGCYDPDCGCIYRYKTGKCAGATAVESCSSFSTLVDRMCPKVDECGAGSDVMNVYNTFMQWRDDWCDEAGVIPTLNCELLPDGISPTTPVPTVATTTKPPLTSAPTTASPVTKPPTTSEPTSAGTTASSATTSEPTTASPVTTSPTTSEPTSAATTASSATTPEPTSTATTAFEPTSAAVAELVEPLDTSSAHILHTMFILCGAPLYVLLCLEF